MFRKDEAGEKKWLEAGSRRGQKMPGREFSCPSKLKKRSKKITQQKKDGWKRENVPWLPPALFLLIFLRVETPCFTFQTLYPTLQMP
ncbi:hypothetical protein, partial [Candidatus Electronema sp. TJ]|uniref:hypothetical protein n=1 Tax=Candidatus Electronema sp. TJ TaxID=3401573 RepID=UPI003AA896F7